MALLTKEEILALEVASSLFTKDKAVIAELKALRKFIKDGTAYERDDAPDEISRVIDNRIRSIEKNGWRDPTEPQQQ